MEEKELTIDSNIAKAVKDFAQDCADYGFTVWYDKPEEEFKKDGSSYYRREIVNETEKVNEDGTKTVKRTVIPTYGRYFFVSDGYTLLLVSMANSGWEVWVRYKKAGHSPINKNILYGLQEISVDDIKPLLKLQSVKEMVEYLKNEAKEEELAALYEAKGTDDEKILKKDFGMKNTDFQYKKITVSSLGLTGCMCWKGLDDIQVSAFSVPKRFMILSRTKQEE